MRRIALIDGWRGISVSFVILGHLMTYRLVGVFSRHPLSSLHQPAEISREIVLRLLATMPSTGVMVFFVISGFLITSILLREEDRQGQISVTGFYLRRAFRILPAFAVFLCVVFLLSENEILPIDRLSIGLAATFLCNTSVHECAFGVGHTWTLAVEEQFYLTWPLLIVLIPPKQRPAFLIVAVSGFTVAALNGLLWAFSFNNGIYFSCIALGCLYAASIPMQSYVQRTASPLTITASIAFILVIQFLPSFPKIYNIANSLEPFAIAFLFFASFGAPDWTRRIFESMPLQVLGLCSYSLYLWQQIFLYVPDNYPSNSWIRDPALLFLCAAASYLLIERPFIAAGRALIYKVQLSPQ